MNKILNMNIHMSPTRIELELTEQCNLKCKFCYNTQNPLISEDPFHIIELLEKEGVSEIILTGGEPMTHPKFFEILDACSKTFVKTMIQTNGTYIDKEIAELFFQKNVFGVNVSLHGKKESHERLTLIDESYEKAFYALKYLTDSNVRAASNFVLTKENIHDFAPTMEDLFNINVREMTLTRFTPTGIGANNDDLTISHKDLIDALFLADDFMKGHKDFYIILANAIPYCALPKELKHFSEYCHFGASRFYIDINGNVLMCGMSREKIGNIFEKGFTEIKASSELYCSHVCGEDVPDYCKKCEFFKVCRGGCRAAALACTGTFNGPDPYCVIGGIYE